MRSIAAAVLVVVAAGAAAAAAAAGTVSGSVSGPVTAVAKGAFVVETTLSPTGSSKISVTSKTTIREQVAVTRSSLRKGECATATGTKSGSSLTAVRISLAPAVKGGCSFGFGNRNRNRRPGGGTYRPPSGTAHPHGFTPPANFGFASGPIAAVKVSTVTVKGTKVVVGSKTQISETKTLAPSAIRKALCAFVFGTSSTGGRTVAAQSVELSPSRNGSCSGFGGRPR